LSLFIVVLFVSSRPTCFAWCYILVKYYSNNSGKVYKLQHCIPRKKYQVKSEISSVRKSLQCVIHVRQAKY